MDPTLIAALAGILGAVIGAVLGGVFALQATKRQVQVMIAQMREDVHERLYSQSLEIMKFFAENPELRPYFYENKDLNRAGSDLERMKVLSTAEMVSGFMELVALQIEQQPPQIKPRWRAYLADTYNSSGVVRQHLDECCDWYAEDLLCLLPPAPVPAQTKTASPNA